MGIKGNYNIRHFIMHTHQRKDASKFQAFLYDLLQTNFFLKV